MPNKPIPKPEDAEPLEEQAPVRAFRRPTLNRRLDDILDASQRTLDLLEQDRKNGLDVDEKLVADLKEKIGSIRSRWGAE